MEAKELLAVLQERERSERALTEADRAIAHGSAAVARAYLSGVIDMVMLAERTLEEEVKREAGQD